MEMFNIFELLPISEFKKFLQRDTVRIQKNEDDYAKIMDRLAGFVETKRISPKDITAHVIDLMKEGKTCEAVFGCQMISKACLFEGNYGVALSDERCDRIKNTTMQIVKLAEHYSNQPASSDIVKFAKRYHPLAVLSIIDDVGRMVGDGAKRVVLIGHCYVDLSSVYNAYGQHEDAISFLSKGITAMQKVLEKVLAGDYKEFGTLHLAQGGELMQTGQFVEAARTLKIALDALKQSSNWENKDEKRKVVSNCEQVLAMAMTRAKI